MNSDNNINETGGAAISSSSFYSRRHFRARICITDHGVTRRREAVNVAELDTNFSESEEGDENEVKNLSSNFVPENHDSSDTDTSSDDQDENVQNVAVKSFSSSFAQTSSSSPAQAPTSSPALAPISSAQPSIHSPAQASTSFALAPIPSPAQAPTFSQSNNVNVRCSKRSVLQVDASFSGLEFPDPPEEDITPLSYFKQFFSNDLIYHLVEQTNLYSVLQSGASINTNHAEMKQYWGILVMMGIVKLLRCRMYWSAETMIGAILIADTMSVNRFEKLKRFFHCNDNSKMLSREDPNYDKLFKVRPVSDSVLQRCKLVEQEETLHRRANYS